MSSTTIRPRPRTLTTLRSRAIGYAPRLSACAFAMLCAGVTQSGVAAGRQRASAAARDELSAHGP
eukprot:2804756-Rhodomonas_salina.1